MALSMNKNQGIVVKMTALAIVLAFAVSAFGPMSNIESGSPPAPEVINTHGTIPQNSQIAEPPVLAAAPIPVEPDTIVIQPNATDGKDAIIWTSSPNANYGIYDTLPTGNGTVERRSLVMFEIPSKIGKLKSATLSLYSSQVTNGPCNISAHAISSLWDEGTLSGANGAVNWSYRTTGQPWVKPGGDFYDTPNSYQTVPVVNAWYSWNVTNLVSNWLGGTWVNNGFILISNNPNPATDNYARFYSSDYLPDATLRPKLTISYAAEIAEPVPAQSFMEDAPARTIPLNGRGNGTVEHTSGVQQTNNLLPFGGAFGDQMRIQTIYTPENVSAEGVITRISFNRSLTPANSGNFSNFKVSLAHTNLDVITNTFANNFMGNLIEVFSATNLYVNSSNGDRWINLDLNDNFTYDSAYNLLMDISWTGSGGVTVNAWTTITSANTRVYSTTGAATGNLELRRTVVKFSVDAVDNGIIDDGTDGNYWPFTDEVGEMRMQMLYNRTLVNESGYIDKISFQEWEAISDWCVLENLSIRLGHSTLDDLTTTYDTNIVGAWTTVFTSPSYNLTSQSNPGWMVIDIDNTFLFNNVNNLVVDIRWRGSNHNTLSAYQGIRLMVNSANTYLSRLSDSNYTGTAGASTDNNLYNARFVFADSASLTWSASSSNTALFTASVSGHNLVIAPKLNMHGAGTARLTLRNSNGITTYQDIPVTITAVNDAPVLSNLADLVCVEDVPRTIDIASNMSDIDNDIYSLVVSTDSIYATVSGTNITFLYLEGVASQIVSVTIKDSGDLTSTKSFNVTVTQINDAPYFVGFPASVTCDATKSTTVNLSPEDEETATNHLTISTNSEYVSVSGHTLHLLYLKGIGSAQVNVYLVDNLTYGTQNNVSYTLDVTIIDHPDVIVHTPTGAAVPVTTTVQTTFDMAMNKTKSENAFTMTLGTIEVNGTFAWNAAGTEMTFTPAGHLTNGIYEIHIAASAENTAGIRMLNAFEWNFTAALGSFDGDNDGMPDQWEMDNDLDPNVNDAQSDADNDGMPNIYEFESNLDPQVNDADLDSDGDGATNLEEYEAGTDPNDPESTPSEFSWIIWVIILVAIIAVVAILLLLMKRKPKPAHVAPEPYQDGSEQFSQNQAEEGNSPPPPPGWNPETPPEGQPPQPDTP